MKSLSATGRGPASGRGLASSLAGSHKHYSLTEGGTVKIMTRRASHVMIYCRTNDVLFDTIPMRGFAMVSTAQKVTPKVTVGFFAILWYSPEVVLIGYSSNSKIELYIIYSSIFEFDEHPFLLLLCLLKEYCCTKERSPVTADLCFFISSMTMVVVWLLCFTL